MGQLISESDYNEASIIISGHFSNMLQALDINETESLIAAHIILTHAIEITNIVLKHDQQAVDLFIEKVRNINVS